MAIEDDVSSDEREKERVERSVRSRLEGLVPDLVKRTFYAGLGAVFTTEEGIRKIANEFSLPKDVANYLINSAQGTKDELMRIVAKEMREFLQQMNFSHEVAKLLTMLSFEVKMEVRFIPNDEAVGGGLKPDIKKTVAFKVNKEDKGEKAEKAEKTDKAE
jgi:hypothetical protein